MNAQMTTTPATTPPAMAPAFELLELELPLFSASDVLVGYEPPAGLPAVDEGESLFRQDVFELDETMYVTLPPAPRPLSSPAPTKSVVPPRIDGVQLKPVPSFVF